VDPHDSQEPYGYAVLIMFMVPRPAERTRVQKHSSQTRKLPGVSYIKTVLILPFRGIHRRYTGMVSICVLLPIGANTARRDIEL
jgi:hypothetical protein